DGGGGRELAVEESWADVGKKREMPAQGQEGGPLGLVLGRKLLPLGSAHRAKEDGVVLLADAQRRVRQRFAMIVDAGAADIRGRGAQGETLLAGDVLQDPQGLGHHLGPYVVSSEYGELQGRHVKGVYR